MAWGRLATGSDRTIGSVFDFAIDFVVGNYIRRVNMKKLRP